MCELTERVKRLRELKWRVPSIAKRLGISSSEVRGLLNEASHSHYEPSEDEITAATEAIRDRKPKTPQGYPRLTQMTVPESMFIGLERRGRAGG